MDERIGPNDEDTGSTPVVVTNSNGAMAERLKADVC